MCEFCLKHGEGNKWYLEAHNYSEDLLADLKRQKFVADFLTLFDQGGEKFKKQFESLDKAPPLIKRLVRWKTVRKLKKDHFGQIVPIEEIEKILGFVNSIIRVPCICRYLLLSEEKRYCYGISMGPDGGKLREIYENLDLDASFYSGPDSKGAEVVSKDEALEKFRVYEKLGLCHSVWTFKTPFIGGLCNCDRPDCLAMQMTVTHGIPMMFRAEYVAELDTVKCDGCRKCMKTCQFGAISFSVSQKKSHIDPRRCYGCGICRSVCKEEAIQLKPRASIPVAANMWH